MDQNNDKIDDCLKKYKNGVLDEEKTKAELEKHFYSQKYLIDQYLTYDSQRQKLSGMAEVVYGEGKSPQQLLQIILSERWEKILITRLSPEKWEKVQQLYYSHTNERQKENRIQLKKTALHYDSVGKIAYSATKTIQKNKEVVIISAGASDFSVVKETEISLHFFQRNTTTIADVGVASLGRILGKMPEIMQHRVIIAIAGMEASMPTLLNSLCQQPIIALPTSVGYGVSSQGISALLSLLSSCSPGMAVVNINGGFSAAALANKILQMPPTTTHGGG